MKRFLGLLVLVFVGVVGWRIGEAISRDAISMTIGVLLGVLAGIPPALLILAAERRRAEHRRTLLYPPAGRLSAPP